MKYVAAARSKGRWRRIGVTRRGRIVWATDRGPGGKLQLTRLQKFRARHWAKKHRLPIRISALHPPKPLGRRAWDEAGKLVGIMERGGNNQGASVERIIKANDGTGPEPWCGDFVAYCYRAAGSKAVERAWASVRALGFLGGQKAVSARELVIGDIVCYTFDHTGLFGRYVDAQGRDREPYNATHIVVREGNTGATGAVSDSATGGDGVYEKIRPIDLVARGVKVLR